MRLLLQHRKELQETEIEIRYPNMTERITRLIQHIRQYDFMLEGFIEDKVYQIPLDQVCYIETIDRKTFIYSDSNIYETRKNIQGMETELEETTIVRISKSQLLNITAVNSVKSYPNHRLMVELNNGEHFKTYLGHFFTETALLYPVNLFFAVNLKWIGINTRSIIL